MCIIRQICHLGKKPKFDVYKTCGLVNSSIVLIKHMIYDSPEIKSHLLVFVSC